jgi:hypothetical protein
MKKRILIVGGTGLIGRKVAQLLHEQEPKPTIFIGSRKEDKNDSSVLKIDVNIEETLQTILEHKIEHVVMCVADANDNVLNFCIKNHIHYLDITKSAPELKQAHQIVQKQPINSQIVFSSGWMSGIVGSLITFVEPNTKAIESVSLNIFYSMQEAGGESSTHFLAEHVAEPFNKFKDNKPVSTRYFFNPITHHFEFGIGKQTVYDLDMSDIFILHEIEKIPSVSVKAAFSSAFTTRLLYWFQKWNIWEKLSLKTRISAFKSRGKGDKIVFDIELHTKNGNHKISVLDKDGQSHLTPFATLLAVQEMLNNPQKGVFYGHQLHNPQRLFEQLMASNKIEIKIEILK